MSRPSKGPRDEVLVRFDPALLQRIDAWTGPPGVTTRTDKVHLLINTGLETCVDSQAPCYHGEANGKDIT